MQKKHLKARRLNGQTRCREQPSINGDFSTSHNLCWHPCLGLRKKKRQRKSYPEHLKKPQEARHPARVSRVNPAPHSFPPSTRRRSLAPTGTEPAPLPSLARRRPGRAGLPRRKPRRPQTRPCDGQGHSGLPASPGPASGAGGGGAFRREVGLPPLTAHPAASPRFRGPAAESPGLSRNGGGAAPGGKGRAGSAPWGAPREETPPTPPPRRRQKQRLRQPQPYPSSPSPPPPPPPPPLRRTHHGERISFRRRGAPARAIRASGAGRGASVPRDGAGGQPVQRQGRFPASLPPSPQPEKQSKSRGARVGPGCRGAPGPP